MIEYNFDVPFISSLALREKQIQQNYRPLIAVHKWFARRPGTLFRGLLLSEFATGPLSEEFYRAHDFVGKRVADPFMGGGTPLVEANRTGCATIGFDINPMAWWIVREQIEQLSLPSYRRAAADLRASLEEELGYLYRTRCIVDGRSDAPVKYFLWVKVLLCDGCGDKFDLFPGYLLSEDVRHPTNVIVCAACGELNEVEDRKLPGRCCICHLHLRTEAVVSRGKAICPNCEKTHSIPGKPTVPFEHRLFAIEYANPDCAKPHKGRFFKRPDPADLERVEEASRLLAALTPKFIPDDDIPEGDETTRLHRWGYRRYREMFNVRQLLGLELSARAIAAKRNSRIRTALATNLSDLLRYQNMLCRYDTMALKSLDIFSVHGFPVGLIQVESNFLGVLHPRTKQPIGSGGWLNIIEKYAKAKAYCDRPFEIRHQLGRKVKVPMVGEWIGERSNGAGSSKTRNVRLECRDSAAVRLSKRSLDAVFTDPPYYGNVQYAELMDFCYAWLRRLVPEFPPFHAASTRCAGELTGNETAGRGLPHFTKGLSRVFSQMATALKEGAPLVFTFHHNDLEAYLPIATAILDAGLTCSASLPCPAEMGGSIHINGTGSSIIDTVFVCRSTGRLRRKWLAENAEELVVLISEDLALLSLGGVKPTEGDARCVAYGHLARLAVWYLRSDWNATLPVEDKLRAISGWIESFGGAALVLQRVRGRSHLARRQMVARVSESRRVYGKDLNEVSF
ncbi:MAG: DNA methylase [Acidobacteriota bacterium]